MKALQDLGELLAFNVVAEYLANQTETIVDAVLRRGLSSEAEAVPGLRVVCLALLQDATPRPTVLLELTSRLATAIRDPAVPAPARAAVRLAARAQCMTRRRRRRPWAWWCMRSATSASTCRRRWTHSSL